MATTPGTIKHRHQSVLPEGTSDVDVTEWNDSEVLAGGANGDVVTRDTTQPDGWGWSPLAGAYAPLASPALTGVPTAPTAAPGTNTTQVATTAFVAAAAAPPAWVAVPYSAANFVGTGGMTWTVTSGNQIRFSYRLSGKTMYVSFYLDATALTGTAANEVRITIPGGATSKGWFTAQTWIQTGSTGYAGTVRALTGGTYFSVYKSDLSNYGIGGAWVFSGSFAFEIT